MFRRVHNLLATDTAQPLFVRAIVAEIVHALRFALANPAQLDGDCFRFEFPDEGLVRLHHTFAGAAATAAGTGAARTVLPFVTSYREENVVQERVDEVLGKRNELACTLSVPDCQRLHFALAALAYHDLQ